MKRFLAIAAVALAGCSPRGLTKPGRSEHSAAWVRHAGISLHHPQQHLLRKSSNGSPAWIEAVLNVSAVPTPKLRVAVQARYALLGTSGNAITLDWAAADYKVNDRFGVRFGKVKTPWGLFNETQDIDSSYMWVVAAAEHLRHHNS